MIINIILVILSLLLENFFNIYFNFTYPLFTIVSLIFININDKKKYYIFCTIVGFIYDLFFTNFFILNCILFFLLAICIYYIIHSHNKKLLYYIITSIFIIFLYLILLYIILSIYGYINYSLIEFSYIIKNYLIINIIYTIILYFINKKLNMRIYLVR